MQLQQCYLYYIITIWGQTTGQVDLGKSDLATQWGQSTRFHPINSLLYFLIIFQFISTLCRLAEKDVKQLTGSRCYCETDLCNKCSARGTEKQDCDYVPKGDGVMAEKKSSSKATKLQMYGGIMLMILILLIKI